MDGSSFFWLRFKFVSYCQMKDVDREEKREYMVKIEWYALIDADFFLNMNGFEWILPRGRKEDGSFFLPANGLQKISDRRLRSKSAVSGAVRNNSNC